MTKRSATHATFVIERNFTAPRARAFNAFADRAAKASWFAGPGEWEKKRHEFDFRVGGRERLSGGPKGGTVHSFDALYQDIVPNERIIYTYDMHLDETRISVSLATVEFKPQGKIIHFMAPLVCMCSTMARIDPQHLAWTLENLAEGRVVNRIKVPARDAELAKVALDRMLAVS